MVQKYPLANCDECPYKENTAFVPTEYPSKKPKLIILGEAPGQQEAKTGIPFTGPSGDLLNNVLKHHGIDRDEAIITNACLCRPPGPTEKPPKAALAACATRLHSEIQQSGVDTIIAVGNTGAQAVLSTGGTITTLRVGPPKPYDLDPKIRVIPTWHPAYCVAPDTKILTSGLNWTPAKDVEVGDELIGFDENLVSGFYEQRQLKPTHVTSKTIQDLPCYEVVTEKATVIASADHMWLAKKDKAYWTQFEWVTTEQLSKEPYLIGHYIEPWNEVKTYESGYIAGFLDGEGYVGHSQLAWSQNPGPTADNMLQLVKEFGFDITVSPVSGSNCYRYQFKGKKDSIKALGMFRPERLVKNGRKLWIDKKADNGTVKVLSVKYLGVKETVAINTTERTFIAEGLLSHNCLRSPDAFPSFVADVGKYNQRERPTWEEPEVRIYDEPEIAKRALQALIDNTDRAVIDIEVGIEKDFNYAHPEDFQMLCVGIAYAKKRTVVFGETAMADQGVRDLMRTYFSGIKLIAHNGKFDLRGLTPVVGLHKLWFDTMLAHYALDERPGGHGLKTLSVELLGAPKYDDELKTYVPRGGNYADVPREILYKYNAMDVACTWELYEMFSSQMDERARRVHDFAVRAANELIHLELNGIKFDHEYNKELSDEYLGEIEAKIGIIQDLVKFEMNPNSVPQVTNYFHSQGIRVKTTGKDFLEEIRPRLSGTVAEFIDRLLEYRRVSKLYGTYIKGLAKRTTYDKVYTTYLLHGTTSGRLASRNPNMQNIVRDKRIRNQFTVEHEDNVLLQLDYKQAEGRVIATLAGDEYLAGIFNDPTRDIFDELTTQIYGDLSGRSPEERKELRVRIKSVFYGLSYGREARSIGNELGISLPEAQELLSNFKALIPATVQWQNKISTTVLNGDDLVTPFGRKRSFYLITEENRKDVLNEALSFMPQSTASDICLSALITLRPMLTGIADVRLTIHDAIVVETHKSRVEEVAEIMKREMLRAGDNFSTFCKFAVDASIGKRLGEL